MGGRWLNRHENWLDKKPNIERRPVGRPVNDSDDYGVRYVPVRCPKCKSKDNKCYASRLPIRYHVCNECGHNFKSVEANDEK